LYVRLLRTDGHSDGAIATFFKKGKGVIVGFRHRYLPEMTFAAKATKSKVVPGRLRELLELMNTPSPDQTSEAARPELTVTDTAPAPVFFDPERDPTDRWIVALSREGRTTVQSEKDAIDDDRKNPYLEKIIRENPAWRNITCQWPVENRNALNDLSICGCAAVDGLCPTHRALVHRPMERMR
jgi:hypothetical protein